MLGAAHTGDGQNIAIDCRVYITIIGQQAGCGEFQGVVFIAGGGFILRDGGIIDGCNRDAGRGGAAGPVWVRHGVVKTGRAVVVGVGGEDDALAAWDGVALCISLRDQGDGAVACVGDLGQRQAQGQAALRVIDIPVIGQQAGGVDAELRVFQCLGTLTQRYRSVVDRVDG